MQTATTLPLVQPDNYLVVDIETGFAPDAEIAAQVAAWQPPKNIKDSEKIEARRAEFAAEAKAKSALTDAAPIMSVAVKGQLGINQINWVLHGFGSGIDIPQMTTAGISVIGFESEPEMLAALGSLLDNSADGGTEIVGHNLLSFDVPKLRNRIIKAKVAMPGVLVPRTGDERQPTYDTMRQAKYFCIEAGNSPFFGFAKLEAALGISNPGHKQIMSGAEYPGKAAECLQLKAEGKAEDYKQALMLLCLYNYQDVVQEEKAYRLMTGRY